MERETPERATERAADHATAVSLMANARYEDIARRLLMQQRSADIARAHGLSPRQIHNILAEPEFVAIYERTRDELFKNLDGLIFDEKAAPLLRARAQAIRSQTVVSEVIETVRARMTAGTAKSSDLRVAVEAAFGMMDRSQTELARAGKGSTTTTVNALSINATARDLIRATVAESGLDLTDLLPAAVVDVPNAGLPDAPLFDEPDALPADAPTAPPTPENLDEPSTESVG